MGNVLQTWQRLGAVPGAAVASMAIGILFGTVVSVLLSSSAALFMLLWLLLPLGSLLLGFALMNERRDVRRSRLIFYAIYSVLFLLGTYGTLSFYLSVTVLIQFVLGAIMRHLRDRKIE